MDELGRRLETFRRAVAKVPFGGDDKAAIAEAKALATWADGLVTELDARKFDTADALRILKQITTIQPPDQKKTRLQIRDAPAPNLYLVGFWYDSLLGTLYVIGRQAGAVAAAIVHSRAARLPDSWFTPLTPADEA